MQILGGNEDLVVPPLEAVGYYGNITQAQTTAHQQS